MLPGEHVAGVVGLEQPTVGEPAHHPAADLLGDGRHRVRRQGRGLAELTPPVAGGSNTPCQGYKLVV
jgi:hypothetical protein